VRSDVIASLYDRLPDFRALVARRDPEGKFGNTHLNVLLGGGTVSTERG
jgi:hypothetical protein